MDISGRTAPTTQKMLDFPKSSQYIRPILLKLSKYSEAKKKTKIITFILISLVMCNAGNRI